MLCTSPPGLILLPSLRGDREKDGLIWFLGQLNNEELSLGTAGGLSGTQSPGPRAEARWEAAGSPLPCWADRERKAPAPASPGPPPAMLRTRRDLMSPSVFVTLGIPNQRVPGSEGGRGRAPAPWEPLWGWGRCSLRGGERGRCLPAGGEKVSKAEVRSSMSAGGGMGGGREEPGPFIFS